MGVAKELSNKIGAWSREERMLTVNYIKKHLINKNANQGLMDSISKIEHLAFKGGETFEKSFQPFVDKIFENKSFTNELQDYLYKDTIDGISNGTGMSDKAAKDIIALNDRAYKRELMLSKNEHMKGTRFNDTVEQTNYSGDKAVRKAFQTNDYSVLRRTRKYEEEGVGYKKV